jgi:hypothetical protein
MGQLSATSRRTTAKAKYEQKLGALPAKIRQAVHTIDLDAPVSRKGENYYPCSRCPGHYRLSDIFKVTCPAARIKVTYLEFLTATKADEKNRKKLLKPKHKGCQRGALQRARGSLRQPSGANQP